MQQELRGDLFGLQSEMQPFLERYFLDRFRGLELQALEYTRGKCLEYLLSTFFMVSLWICMMK
jgi:hypothetical protein